MVKEEKLQEEFAVTATAVLQEFPVWANTFMQINNAARKEQMFLVNEVLKVILLLRFGLISTTKVKHFDKLTNDW